MKIIKYFVTSTLLFFIPLTSFADNCSWTHQSVPAGGATASVVFSCFIGGEKAAVKTVGAKAKGSASCSISLFNDFYNSGTCAVPNITTVDPCENSGAHYGTFMAGQWSNHIDRIENFCGACGYQTIPIWQPGGGEPLLEVTCR